MTTDSSIFLFNEELTNSILDINNSNNDILEDYINYNFNNQKIQLLSHQLNNIKMENASIGAKLVKIYSDKVSKKLRAKLPNVYFYKNKENIKLFNITERGIVFLCSWIERGADINDYCKIELTYDILKKSDEEFDEYIKQYGAFIKLNIISHKFPWQKTEEEKEEEIKLKNYLTNINLDI